MGVFGKRLKEARERAGISQKRLGILAGIDEFVASARINRYEKSVHEPDLHTAARLAKALETPLPYFFADDDDLAEILELVARLSKLKRARLIQMLREGRSATS